MNALLLSKTPLFRGSTPEEVESMLGCLGVDRRKYARGERILHTGEVVTALGMVLSG